MALKTVPFNPAWVDSNKVDLMAVYRRPRTQPITKARLTDEQGRQLWDYVTLPLRRHNDWMKKGYQYVTLARVADLIAIGATSAEILAGYLPSGEPEERTFRVQEYLRQADAADVEEFGRLKTLVYQLGSDTVLAVRRHDDPGFELPESLRDIAPGTPLPNAEPASEAKKIAGKARGKDAAA